MSFRCNVVARTPHSQQLTGLRAIAGEIFAKETVQHAHQEFRLLWQLQPISGYANIERQSINVEQYASDHPRHVQEVFGYATDGIEE